METDISKYIGNTFQHKDTSKIVYVFLLERDPREEKGAYKYHMYYYDGLLRSQFISDTKLKGLKKTQLDSRDEAIRHIIISVFEPHPDRNVAISENIVLRKLMYGLHELKNGYKNI